MPIQNLIQRGDLNQRLTKALEIKGQKSPILTLDNQVVAVVIAEDLTKQTVFREPSGKRAGFSRVVPFVALQTVIGVIFNPVGSGLVIVPHLAFLTASSTTEVVGGFADPLALPPTASAPVYLDNRNLGVSPVLCRSGTDGALRIVTELWRYNTGASTGAITYPPLADVAIQPGQAFGCQHVAGGLGGSISIWWEEFAV